MVPLTKTSNWHFEEENNCAKSLFFSFVRKVVLSLFQSILKLFKVHKVFTPFLTYCDTWNFATFFNIYSTLQYSFITKPFYSVQMEVKYVFSNPIIFYFPFLESYILSNFLSEYSFSKCALRQPRLSTIHQWKIIFM